MGVAKYADRIPRTAEPRDERNKGAFREQFPQKAIHHARAQCPFESLFCQLREIFAVEQAARGENPTGQRIANSESEHEILNPGRFPRRIVNSSCVFCTTGK